MTNEELVQYYQDLLIIQYSNKENAGQMVSLFVSAAMLYEVICNIRKGFDPNTAKGEQLDIIAKYVGATRIVNGIDFFRNYFGFAPYGSVAPFTFYGFIAYGDIPGDVQFRSYAESGQSLFTLTDDELRTIIKLAIIRNNSLATVKLIDDFLFETFGADVYMNEVSNMNIAYYVTESGQQRLFQIARALNILPVPAGVGAVVITV